ncbi:hypothetical protein ARMGADRAFT_1017141 [Armillaria gallica]|uniref:Uncharacterized protein n=1 Tax=Armillaria gallica TaxID=47427 RepID=A0A2H3CUK4_ARMGA|nr:hypothetical protein ARMGADRAFT_1017141 [Armillaria gallica]
MTVRRYILAAYKASATSESSHLAYQNQAFPSPSRLASSMPTLVTFEPYGTVSLSALALILVAGSIAMYWLAHRNRRRRIDWDVEMVEA